MFFEAFNLSVVWDRVAGVEHRNAVDIDYITEVGIALLGVLIEFFVFGWNSVNMYFLQAQLIVAFHRVNSVVIDSEAQHSVTGTFRHEEMGRWRLSSYDWDGLRVDMVGVIMGAEHNVSMVDVFGIHRGRLDTHMLVGFASGYFFSVGTHIRIDINNSAGRLEDKTLLAYPPDLKGTRFDLCLVYFVD